jgi:hypothetical protein
VAVVEPTPLTPDQLRAAALIGRGWQYKDAAAEVGVHAETVSRWTRREDFQEAVKQARVDHMDEQPEAVKVLEQALSATKADGSPDWRIRVDAARTLVGRKGTGGGAAPAKVRERRIYVPPDEDDADSNE